MAKETTTAVSSVPEGLGRTLALARLRCPPAGPAPSATSAPTTSTNLPQSLTAILSLPIELVHLILSSCTNSALLALSQTCRGLHEISLHTFFKRNDILDPVSGWLSARLAPRETLDAIRVALSVKKLPTVNWYFNPGWECNICNSLEEDEDTDEHGMCSCHSEPVSESRLATAESRMGPLKRTFDEVANLRAIIARLQNVDQVALHLSVIDLWLGNQARNHPDALPKRVDRDLWRAAFVGLLDEVLDKGCQKLQVYVGENLQNLYRDENLGLEGELSVPVAKQPTTNRHKGDDRAAKQVRNQPRKRHLKYSLRFPLIHLIGVLQRIFQTSNKRASPPSEWSSKSAQRRRQLKLKELLLHSDMLLLPPFYDWTRSLLSSSALASTLTHLSFKPGQIAIPSPFLTSVNLPSLTEFEIVVILTVPRDGTETGRAKFEDVAGFLGRHSGHLKKVRLYGVGVPPSVPGRDAISGSTMTSTPFFESRKPIFPHLQSFSAHPAYIIWLLDLVISTPSASFFRQRNKSFGNLTSIGVTSEYYTSAPSFQYTLFDEALRALVRFRRWQNGGEGVRALNATRSRMKKKEPEKTIELKLVFASENGIEEWFAGHLPSSPEEATDQTNSDSPPPRSILTQLTHVSLLTISTFHFIKLPHQTIDILPDWLALVSNSSDSSSSTAEPGTPSTLQSVNFIDHPSGGFPCDEDLFAKRVAQKCVKLKRLQLQWKSVIELDKVRAEIATGPGEDKSDGG